MAPLEPLLKPIRIIHYSLDRLCSLQQSVRALVLQQRAEVSVRFVSLQQRVRNRIFSQILSPNELINKFFLSTRVIFYRSEPNRFLTRLHSFILVSSNSRICKPIRFVTLFHSYTSPFAFAFSAQFWLLFRPHARCPALLGETLADGLAYLRDKTALHFFCSTPCTQFAFFNWLLVLLNTSFYLILLVFSRSYVTP